jgi:cytochrome c
MPKPARTLAFAGLAATLSAIPASAQFTYPNCANAMDADFTVTPVITRALNDGSILEPLKMDFSTQADGTVDVFYIQRKGEVKKFDGKTKAVTLLGTLAVETGNEDGLVGIALDPDFKSNKRIFLYYSHTSGFRLSRFNLNPEGRLDPASEKILLGVPSARGKWHTSGAMRFDAYKDLWVNIGDNETTHKGPANTDDLRGSIIRIHPEENGTYSIPKGNMWEATAAYFQGKGQSAVAEKYRDSTRMKREVYVKGIRNAYTLTVDPVRRWAVYGDCGPDQESGGTPDRSLWTEEQNVVTEPGFMGWPYWSADQKDQTVFPYGDPIEKADWNPGAKDPLNPVNNFAGMELQELPPAKPGTYNYAHSCAMTGPIFRYDGRLANAGQLPPHFNRVWFTTDFNKGKINAVRLTNDGKMTGEAVEVFKNLGANFLRPLDFQQGPDGSLYYLNYSCGTWRVTDACTGIYRIDYKGTCKDANLLPESPVATAPTPGRSLLREVAYDPASGTLRVRAAGRWSMEVFAVDGRSIFSARGQGEARQGADRIFAGRPSGLYRVRLVTPEGESALTLPWLATASP